MTVGETIQLRREHLGWSQRELARRTGIPQSNLSRIEAGHNPKVDTMTRIEAVLQEGERILALVGPPSSRPATVKITLNLSLPVLQGLRELGGTGMFADTTAEVVAEELLRAAVRDMLRST